MTARELAAVSLTLWVGATLVLSRSRRINRTALADRLRPYAAGLGGPPATSGLLSYASFRELLEPAARAAGARLASLFGVGEELALRLERCHSRLDPTAFRMRQLGWATAAFGAGGTISLAAGLAAPSALLAVFGLPLLAFLVVEQQLATESARWQQRVRLELPVIAEQLGMLLSAGYSLGAALNRIAARGSGACSRDLARATSRVRQGLSEVEALREWALVSGLATVERLVAVLALNHEAGDIGRLVADEARAIRRDAQRDLVVEIERRSQQVWIPVTVATLLPGVIFLAVPFIEAMRLFAGS